ncbi:hypothetical protein Pelo_18497 [Pelomyxa schiedti]|nr:hypothetical protein Pelo_18497 [Pelomyxa schiedti]
MGSLWTNSSENGQVIRIPGGPHNASYNKETPHNLFPPQPLPRLVRVGHAVDVAPPPPLLSWRWVSWRRWFHQLILLLVLVIVIIIVHDKSIVIGNQARVGLLPRDAEVLLRSSAAVGYLLAGNKVMAGDCQSEKLSPGDEIASSKCEVAMPKSLVALAGIHLVEHSDQLPGTGSRG